MMVLSNFFAKIKIKKVYIYLASLGIVCVCVCVQMWVYFGREKMGHWGECKKARFIHNLKIGYLLPNKW